MKEPVTNKQTQSFRDLRLWQRAMDLSLDIYELTRSFPREEVFGLTSQLRRCAVSIPSNVAEGQGRKNAREFAHFLRIARGSNCELQIQLDIADKLHLGDAELVQRAMGLSHEIGKMLFAPSRKLKDPILERT